MKALDIREKYLNFYNDHGHKIIPSSSLVPENDPTTLFTSAGMQPMLPYLLGESHPEGTRIVDSQKVFRSQDIEEVGDNRHDTFFEMLGNWSLGDYWKKDQLTWLFEFLTKELDLDPHSLYVTAFEGDPKFDLPKDEETVSIWQELFKSVNIDAKVGEKIFYYNAKKNWWSRSGVPENMPEGEPGMGYVSIPDAEKIPFVKFSHSRIYELLAEGKVRYFQIGDTKYLDARGLADLKALADEAMRTAIKPQHTPGRRRVNPVPFNLPRIR